MTQSPDSTRRLVVFDLNGTLEARLYNKQSGHLTSELARRAGNYVVYERPHLQELLSLVFSPEMNCDVAIVTSANRRNAMLILSAIMSSDMIAGLKYIITGRERKTLSELPISLGDYRRVLIVDDSLDKVHLNDKQNYYIVPTYGPHLEYGDNALWTLSRVMDSLLR